MVQPLFPSAHLCTMPFALPNKQVPDWQEQFAAIEQQIAPSHRQIPGSREQISGQKEQIAPLHRQIATWREQIPIEREQIAGRKENFLFQKGKFLKNPILASQ